MQIHSITEKRGVGIYFFFMAVLLVFTMFFVSVQARMENASINQTGNGLGYTNVSFDTSVPVFYADNGLPRDHRINLWTNQSCHDWCSDTPANCIAFFGCLTPRYVCVAYKVGNNFTQASDNCLQIQADWTDGVNSLAEAMKERDLTMTSLNNPYPAQLFLVISDDGVISLDDDFELINASRSMGWYKGDAPDEDVLGLNDLHSYNITVIPNTDQMYVNITVDNAYDDTGTRIDFAGLNANFSMIHIGITPAGNSILDNFTNATKVKPGTIATLGYSAAGSFDIFVNGIREGNFTVTDTGPPTATQDIPANETFFTVENITAACNASDGTGLYNVSILIWNSTGLYYNATQYPAGGPTINRSAWELTAVPNANYYWRCEAYDTDGNYDASDNFYFFNVFTDKYPPNVTLASPLNDTTDLTGNLTFNCTMADDGNLSNVTFYLWNSTGLYNTSFATSGSTANESIFNFTDLPDEHYQWNCFVEDKFNKSAWAENNNSLYVNTSFTPGWYNITPPQGVFEPYNASLTGTHKNTFAIKFYNLTISNGDVLSCIINLSNNSLMTVSANDVSMIYGNYSLNYTVGENDSVINDPTKGFLPWFIKNCTLSRAGSIEYNQSVRSRIYIHSPQLWTDSEITRVVACQGTAGTYFDNIVKCEFQQDTFFAINMRNGNAVNCFATYPEVDCSNNYCQGIMFPMCDPPDPIEILSPEVYDPNGYANFTISPGGGHTTLVSYTFYTNTSENGSFRVRIVDTLAAETFSVTIYNLSNVSNATVYGAETGGGNTTITHDPEGSWNVAHNRLGSPFTGTLDFTFNITFNETMSLNRTLRLVVAYGANHNQQNPALFNVTFNPDFGLFNTNESQNTSVTNDTGGVCGDEANNDFDYLGGTWANSYDCFDPDCSYQQGDDSQSNEFGTGKTGLCTYATEQNCSDEFDNDYDYIAGTGFTDCHDTDCFHVDTDRCPFEESTCNDGLNNDWDYTLGESNSSAAAKIGNNGTKYDSTHIYNLTDCEDPDCNGSQGGGVGQFCTWGIESNCTDGFNNDVLQMMDCQFVSVENSMTLATADTAEYDCAGVCRNASNAENGSYCDDNLDNDYDAVVMTGYYSNQYTQNGSIGAGVDCRWGGYYGYGSDYNPDEGCNQTVLSSGFVCQLAQEANCTDGFDNDFDSNATAGTPMPNANWTSNTAGYQAYFNVSWVNDADFDDYDCKAQAPTTETTNLSWCFDGADNDLDAYYWNGTVYAQNASTGIDCADPDCLGVTNPENENQSCLSVEYNASDTFFTNLSFPGFYCNNSRDDDADLGLDCYDSDCHQQFDMCTAGPCYSTENKSWSACFDSTDNDFDNVSDCSDSDCVDMVGDSSGALCLATETICDDGFNNDAQGGTDCADHSDCDNEIGGYVNNASVYCRAAETTAADCFDGFDNDADGDLDCHDADCSAACELYNISGTSPITLPQWNGQKALNGTAEAVIEDYTDQVRLGEWYNISFRMDDPSNYVLWSLGTGVGNNGFNKSAFNLSSAYLAGSHKDFFILNVSDNGFVIESNKTAMPTGYRVSMLILANKTLAAANYEVTYTENASGVTSTNNLVQHEIDENVSAVANSIEVSPNTTGIEFGQDVFIRANITDNNALGACAWDITGAAAFDPADSTTCRASFTPTVEGLYYVNVTPVDYYSNNGTMISVNYTVNLLPGGEQASIDKNTPYYNPNYGHTVTFNGSFSVPSSDTLGRCWIYAKNHTGDEFYLGTFTASGDSCRGAGIDISGLADGEYRIYAVVNETTEEDFITGNSTLMFVCRGTSTDGACKFADFDANSEPDICSASSEIPHIDLLLPADATYQSVAPVNLTFNATDDNTTFLECNVTLDSSIIGTVIAEHANVSNVSYIAGQGLHSWNVTCFDNLTNGNTSVTWTFTVDSTVPHVQNVTALPTPSALGAAINITANITDSESEINYAVANITYPNGSSAQVILRNQTGFADWFNASFTDTFVIGQFNVTISANDTLDNKNNTQITTFVIQDQTVPDVYWANATPPNVNASQIVNVTANVTDNYLLDVVLMEVLYPNGSRINYSMDNVTADIFNYSFTDSSGGGRYNITIYANDTSSGINFTINTSFTVTISAIASAENLTITLNPDYSVNLSWSQVSDADGYYVYHDSNGTRVLNWISAPATQNDTVAGAGTLVYTDTSAINASERYYRVAAYKGGITNISDRTAGKFDKAIAEGLNLVAAPFTLSHTQFTAVNVSTDPFATRPAESISTVYRFVNNSYYKNDYLEGFGYLQAPGSYLNFLGMGDGYYVDAKNAANITFVGLVPPQIVNYTLGAGYNLFGYSSIRQGILGNESQYMVFNVTPADCIETIYKYSGESSRHEKTDHLPGYGFVPTPDSSSFTTVDPAVGYWLSVTEACTLTKIWE